jgi:hypothetical protein
VLIDGELVNTPVTYSPDDHEDDPVGDMQRAIDSGLLCPRWTAIYALAAMAGVGCGPATMQELHRLAHGDMADAAPTAVVDEFVHRGRAIREAEERCLGE